AYEILEDGIDSGMLTMEIVEVMSALLSFAALLKPQEFKEAIQLQQLAHTTLNGIYGNSSSRTQAAMEALINSLIASNEWDTAALYLEAFIEVLTANNSSHNDSRLLQYLEKMAETYSRLGRD